MAAGSSNGTPYRKLSKLLQQDSPIGFLSADVTILSILPSCAPSFEPLSIRSLWAWLAWHCHLRNLASRQHAIDPAKLCAHRHMPASCGNHKCYGSKMLMRSLLARSSTLKAQRVGSGAPAAFSSHFQLLHLCQLLCSFSSDPMYPLLRAPTALAAPAPGISSTTSSRKPGFMFSGWVGA